MRVSIFSYRCKFLKQILGVRNCHASQQEKQQKVKMVAHILPEVEAQLEAGEIKHRKHPGKNLHKCVSLPKSLIKTIHKVIEDSNIPSLTEEKKAMTSYIYHRRLPMEANELNARTAEAMQKMNIPETVIYEKDLESKKKVQRLRSKLQCELGRWKPIEYHMHSGIVYMVSRFMQNYAATYQVFTEIMKAIPSFQPKTYFDFGSGVGASLWAAHHFWESSLQEHFCVDASADMNTLCELLLKGGSKDVDAPSLLKNVYFRQFLPVSGERKYDIVISAFSMMDLPSALERLKVIDVLWQKTNDILVFIENGSKAGFFTILEARDYILKVEALSGDYSRGVHVVAPCPHEMECPKFKNSIHPCHFSVKFNPIWPKKEIYSARSDLYTYVVLRKGHKDKSKYNWPRIVEPVLSKSKLARCQMCCDDGKLHEIYFSKKRYPKHIFQCAKKSRQGDLLPFTLSERVESDDESSSNLIDDDDDSEEEEEELEKK